MDGIKEAMDKIAEFLKELKAGKKRNHGNNGEMSPVNGTSNRLMRSKTPEA